MLMCFTNCSDVTMQNSEPYINKRGELRHMLCMEGKNWKKIELRSWTSIANDEKLNYKLYGEGQAAHLLTVLAVRWTRT